MVMPREERPPYITFESRPVEDRAASIKNGRWTAKDVPYVIITPQGSKDRIERNAAEWFTEKRQHVQEQRFPGKWLRAYEEAFEAWKKDEEPPVNGAPLRNWPPISPTQYKTLRDLRLLTVEDLASANEETLSRIGMGGRALKAKAVEWLAQASGLGIQVEEAERLRADNVTLSQVNAELQMRVDNLSGIVAAMPKATATQVDGGMRIDLESNEHESEGS